MLYRKNNNVPIRLQSYISIHSFYKFHVKKYIFVKISVLTLEKDFTLKIGKQKFILMQRHLYNQFYVLGVVKC